MTASAVLKKVIELYPEILDLPKPKLKLVEDAIVYATKLSRTEESLSEEEHQKLLQDITGKEKLTSADRLKSYRMRADLTQLALAKKTGIPQANISAMESGRRPIGLQSAKKLAKVLRCDFRQIV